MRFQGQSNPRRGPLVRPGSRSAGLPGADAWHRPTGRLNDEDEARQATLRRLSIQYEQATLERKPRILRRIQRAVEGMTPMARLIALGPLDSLLT